MKYHFFLDLKLSLRCTLRSDKRVIKPLKEEYAMYLELKNIFFSYDKEPVLKDISFGMNRGEITGLIGSNGTGKTTTIHNIIKKLKPQRGQILLDGKDIQTLDESKFPISYIPDTPVYYEELTLLEHLRFVKALYPESKIDISVLVNRFELQEHLNKVPGLLSKGTLQKMMIAIALIREYDVFVADEPLNGLDPKQISIFKNILLEMKQKNKAILISTHLLDMVEGICDKYIFLHQGTVVASGTKEEVAKQYHLDSSLTLEELYLLAIQ